MGGINIKLSQYIEYLQKIIDKYGDLDCVVWTENDDWDSLTQGWYERYDGDPEEFISNFACTYIDNKGIKQYATINDKGYIDCRQERVFEVLRKGDKK